MKRFFALTLFAVAAVPAFALLPVEFDTLADGSTTVAGTDTFTFGPGVVVENESDFQSYSNTAAFPSYSKAIYNGFGVQAVSMSRVGDFDFLGGYFIGWGQNDNAVSTTSSTITIEGWDNGILVGSVTKSLLTDSFRYVATNFTSVDTVVFKNDGVDSHWWLGDSFRTDKLEAVPEPVSMVGLGLGAVALLRRRRK